MGGSLDLNPPKKRKLIEIFDELFPYYLSIGMTYELYWNGRPELVKAYRKSFEMNNKKKNQELWMQGVYIQYALDSIVGNMFRKGNKSKYPDEPLPITERELKEKKERESKERYERIRRNMELAMIKINEKNGGGLNVNNN